MINEADENYFPLKSLDDWAKSDCIYAFLDKLPFCYRLRVRFGDGVERNKDLMDKPSQYSLADAQKLLPLLVASLGLLVYPGMPASKPVYLFLNLSALIRSNRTSKGIYKLVADALKAKGFSKVIFE